MAGLGYKLHAEPADRRTPEGRLVLAGLYAWRDGAPTTWEEGARQMAGQAVKWRGLVVARPSPHSIAPEPTRRLPLPVIRATRGPGIARPLPETASSPRPSGERGRG
jgi:hypothetical protein